jgi:glycosyltransferase involved in cell wall biosynthesis
MRITFVGPLVSRFVSNDLKVLRTEHTVYAYDGNIGRGWKALVNLAWLSLKLSYSVLRSDAILYWFADYYSGIPTYVAKLLHKKIFIIAGGFDIWYLPELGIGAKTRPLRWWAVKTGFKNATLILPVSNYAKAMMETNIPKYGPAVVAYSAVESELIYYSGEKKEPIALTVTQVDTVPEYTRKGIDIFIRAAAQMPQVRFQIVGIRGDAEVQSRKDAAGMSNVEIIPAPIPRDDLRKYYSIASVYCQLSIDETFGLAIAEAMNCGCIPVVSEPPVFLEVIGECGYVAHRSDLPAIVAAIQKGIDAPQSDRDACIERASMFHLSVRSKHILSLIK